MPPTAFLVPCSVVRHKYKIGGDLTTRERVSVGRIHLQICPEVRIFGDAEIEQIYIMSTSW